MGSGSDTVQVSILIPTHVRMYRIGSEGTYQHSYVRRSKANPSLASSESRPNQLPTILVRRHPPFAVARLEESKVIISHAIVPLLELAGDFDETLYRKRFRERTNNVPT